MSHLQEKLEIARELGLMGYVSAQEAKVAEARAKEEREAVIQELTAMKFKPITVKEIANYFPKWAFGWSFDPQTPLGMFLVGISCGVSAGIYDYSHGQYVWPVVVCFIIGGAIGLGLEGLLGCIRRVQIASMPLSKWTDELPRGALLALKEAKEAGVVAHNYGSYTIYYPRLEARLKGDPVITGLYKGVEVEIFAWDDKKIRPEDY